MEIRLKAKQKCLKWSLLSIILAILGLVIIITDPISHAIKYGMKMKEGSMMHDIWSRLPVELLQKVYLFNITNAEKFISGEDDKLKYEEIGPYVYKEIRENINITYNPNGTMTFVPKVTPIFMPNLSSGDPKVDRIYSLNLPLLGAFSLYAKASIWKQMGLNIFIQTLNAATVLNLTVDELFWGYDDQLVKMVSDYFPSWMPFDRFGLLKLIYDESIDVITMNLNDSSDSLYSIDKWNGVSGLPIWGYTDENSSLPCNSLQNVYEGALFPSTLREGSNVTLYKKIFCRTLKANYVKTVTMETGMKGYEYILPENIFSASNPDNVCYCRDQDNCLPDGFSDVSPCYFDLPVALSLPHFMNVNESEYEKLEGLKPDISKHLSYVYVQPEIGLPLKISSKMQLNLIVGNVGYNNKLRRFKNMKFPVAWVDVQVEELPAEFILKIKFIFMYLPIIQTTLSWLMITIGLILFVYKIINYLLFSVEIPNTTLSHNYIPVALHEYNPCKSEKL